MLKIFKYFRPIDWIISIIVILLTGVSVWLDLELPLYMGEIVQLLTSGSPVISDITSVGIKMLAVALFSAGITVLLTFLASLVSNRLSERLRKKLFTTVGGFSSAEINKFSTASLITRSTNDVSQVQHVVNMMLRMMLYAPIMAITAIFKIIERSRELTSITAIALGLMIALIVVMFLLVVPKFKIMQKNTDDLNAITRENLTGLKVIRANNAEDLQEQKFDHINNKLTKTILYTNKVSSFMMPGMNLIQSGLSLAIVWFGSYLMSINSINYATVTVFSQYAVHVLISFLVISMLFIMLPRGIVSAKRINEVLETKPTIVDGKGVSPSIKGQVEFKNVSFKYPDAESYILEDISFTAKQGQTIAFIGSTGSGKSTLINLIPRLFDATDGEVLIDGENIKDYKISELNNKLGYIPQKALLFSGSLRENVAYGNNSASDDEIINALKIAQAEGLIEKLEGGLDAYISQGGKNVSGGQRQRVCIARAILKNPEIYIFDDSFSALDYATDKKLRNALKKYTKDTTKLIVAQRIGTIMDADEIIVLDEGKIVGRGKHKDLLQSCKIYSEIAYSQLSKEELM